MKMTQRQAEKALDSLEQVYIKLSKQWKKDVFLVQYINDPLDYTIDPDPLAIILGVIVYGYDYMERIPVRRTRESIVRYAMRYGVAGY